jgi:hypothetical protein
MPIESKFYKEKNMTVNERMELCIAARIAASMRDYEELQ